VTDTPIRVLQNSQDAPPRVIGISSPLQHEGKPNAGADEKGTILSMDAAIGDSGEQWLGREKISKLEKAQL
jgi:hypothetical protein